MTTADDDNVACARSVHTLGRESSKKEKGRLAIFFAFRWVYARAITYDVTVFYFIIIRFIMFRVHDWKYALPYEDVYIQLDVRASDCMNCAHFHAIKPCTSKPLISAALLGLFRVIDYLKKECRVRVKSAHTLIAFKMLSFFF